jgi:excisionase family DNA binding protein
MWSDEFVTVAEIAELFKLNQQTVRNWIDSGELPAIRLGSRRVRIRRADLDAFIEASSTATTDPATSDTNARAELEAAISETRVALDGTDNAALVTALKELSAAARRLAKMHEVRGPGGAARAT